MATVDPLQTLQAALTVPADSTEQADLLASLRESLEAQPGPIPLLCTTLLPRLAAAGDSLLKRWVLDLLQYAICRSPLAMDVRTQLGAQSLDLLASLLADRSPFVVKLVVQCFAGVYPLLFRSLCMDARMRQQWDTLARAKATILDWVQAPTVGVGVKLAAVKFMQRVIIVQTRGVTDPRLQKANDPSIAMCPSNHPFINVAQLEDESRRLLESVITILWTSQNVDILSAILNSWATLAKVRPGVTALMVSTLASWTPAALNGLPASEIKSVEKAVRILLSHIARTPHGAPHQAQIQEALANQAVRMDRAATEEKQRRATTAADGARIKRPPSQTIGGATDPKRVKTEHDAATAAASASFLASFDFTSLPAALVTDLIVANMFSFSDQTFSALIQGPAQAVVPGAAQETIPGLAPVEPVGNGMASAVPVPSTSAAEAKMDDGGGAEPDVMPVKEEVVDPLEMVVDGDEIEYEPDKLNMELAGDDAMVYDSKTPEDDEKKIQLLTSDFELPPPEELDEDERHQLLRTSMARLWEDAADDTIVRKDFVTDTSLTPDLWMLLVVRMITRVVHNVRPRSQEREGEDEKTPPEDVEPDVTDVAARQDRLRQTLCDYIMADFPARTRLATSWMNEEWYNDRIRQSTPGWVPNYDIWLNQILSAYQMQIDAKDKTFPRFLLDIPAVPSDVFDLLRELCTDPERREVGFGALRGFVMQRPALRDDAVRTLLDLTTHPEKLTRAAAINTVRRWVPDMHPMDGMVREFALQMLRRLQSHTQPPSGSGTAANGASPNEDAMDEEDGQLPPEDLVKTPYLQEQIELPARKSEVLQHVELFFALSVKVPEFLDGIFAAYGQMDESVQQTIQELITPLIRSLGPNHGKLLTLLRTFPPGAESLALRILTIFTENGRPSAPLVALVKSLIAERDLDARFLIPIIGEMDKADITRYLPRIVSTLNGTPDNKTLVRNVFSSIVTTPSQTFGTMTSNLPRVRQTDLLAPAELMVMLHNYEKDIGMKSAIEAIGICFSMTDVFREEILAVVMQQIVDEPVLPTLFLRTVIQAVTTYKSLVRFVSANLLSRLITKKIWTNTPLWVGFIKCAKIIAPASFGALLQLPREQLRDLVERQPDLKAGLKDYVMKKAGNRARMAGFLDLFGDEPAEGRPPDLDGGGSAQAQAQPATPPPTVPTPG